MLRWIWRHCYKRLGVEAENHPLLLMESAWLPKDLRPCPVATFSLLFGRLFLVLHSPQPKVSGRMFDFVVFFSFPDSLFTAHVVLFVGCDVFWKGFPGRPASPSLVWRPVV